MEIYEAAKHLVEGTADIAVCDSSMYVIEEHVFVPFPRTSSQPAMTFEQLLSDEWEVMTFDEFYGRQGNAD